MKRGLPGVLEASLLVVSVPKIEQIVNEFNRYNRVPKLRVEGGVAALRFTGGLGARNPESLLAYLASREQGSLL